MVRDPRIRRFIFFAVGLVVLIGALSLVGQKSLLKVYQMTRTRTELQEEIVRLRQVNDDLAREIQAFTHDPSQVEAVAREDLGLVKPGEIVYQFGPSRPATALPNSPR